MSTSAGVTILLVEDRPADAEFVKQLLVEHRNDLEIRDQDYVTDIESIEHVDCLADAIERVASEDIDLVLLDLGLPDSEGLDTVSTMCEQAEPMPIIVLTGQKGIGVSAIQCGAQDYLIKGQISADSLLRTIAYAIERARVTRKLQDRNNRLALVNEILRTDIRNDMSRVIGWGDLLHDRVPKDEQATVEKLLEASRHALTLADTAAELIDVLSKPGMIEPVPCELRSMLQAELDQCRQEAPVDLTVDWQVTDESITVLGTPMLSSVFKHLLRNAVTHTDHTEPTITVTIRQTTETVSVAVADDGVGISDAQKNRIVDPEPSTGSHIGNGLYFVTTVLNSIGGELIINDNVPTGTIMTVRLDRLDRVDSIT